MSIPSVCSRSLYARARPILTFLRRASSAEAPRASGGRSGTEARAAITGAPRASGRGLSLTVSSRGWPKLLLGRAGQRLAPLPTCEQAPGNCRISPVVLRRKVAPARRVVFPVRACRQVVRGGRDERGLRIRCPAAGRAVALCALRSRGRPGPALSSATDPGQQGAPALRELVETVAKVPGGYRLQIQQRGVADACGGRAAGPHAHQHRDRESAQPGAGDGLDWDSLARSITLLRVHRFSSRGATCDVRSGFRPR